MNLFTTVSVSLPILPVLLGCIATFLFGHRKSNSGIPGLLFHSVLPDPSLNQSHFSSEQFRLLVQSLKERNITAITIDDFKSSPQDKNNILITFDDGLENFYTCALPVLQEAGFKATVFCVAGYLGKVSSWDVYNGSPHLTMKQIREICDMGHQIGSHTLTHANLPYISSQDLACELKDSRAILEDITGKPVTSLSFPHGSWNLKVWKRAQEAGYRTATLYRNHVHNCKDLIPVHGVYRFDTTTEIISRIISKGRFSISLAKARMISQFAKGTPVWKFRKNYISIV